MYDCNNGCFKSWTNYLAVMHKDGVKNISPSKTQLKINFDNDPDNHFSCNAIFICWGIIRSNCSEVFY